jgi:predicted nucleic acid-binding protein
MSRWVVDTGPLIFPAKLDHLSLLEQSAAEVFIPPTVLAEVRAQPDEATEKIEAATQRWLRVQNVGNKEVVALLLANLDDGEAEVIALARENQGGSGGDG